MTSSWPRDEFRDALWGSRSLKPLERLVAFAYAEHAGSEEFAWVTYPRLQECTGLSRDAIARAIDGLRVAGWLVEKEAARQQRSTRYWLRVPQQSVTQTAETAQPPASRTAGYPQPSVSQPAEESRPLPDGLLSESSRPSPGTSPLPPDISTLPGRADQSSHHSTDQSIDAREVPTEHRPAVVELFARLAPAITEQDAAFCVAWVAAKKKPDNLAGYVSRFPADDVLAKAALWLGDRRAQVADTSKCPHGMHNGSEVLGSGAAASRRCGRCEQSNPAETSAPLAAPRVRRSNDIDWEAAARRAAARDAAALTDDSRSPHGAERAS